MSDEGELLRNQIAQTVTDWRNAGLTPPFWTGIGDQDLRLADALLRVFDVRLREPANDLELENAALREELRSQWESNHFEHCGRRWPHPVGDRCFWPVPDVLTGVQPPTDSPQ